MAQEVEDVLEPFGLRLARETIHVHEGEGNRGRYIRGGLTARAAAMVKYLQGEEETTSADWRFRRRLSVDYSKYFTDPWIMGYRRQPNLCQLIHFRRLLEDQQGWKFGLHVEDRAVKWVMAALNVDTAEDSGHGANGDGTDTVEQTASVQVHAGADDSHNSNSTNIDDNSTNVGNMASSGSQGVASEHSDTSDIGEEWADRKLRNEVPALGKSLASMLFCYNWERIEVFRLDVVKAGTYLPLADRMKSLKIIMPQGAHIATPLLSKVAQFIHRNQSAFPTKESLDLDAKYIEYCNDVVYMDYGDSSVPLERDEFIEHAAKFQGMLLTFRAFKEKQRLHTAKITRPYLELYRAIGRPRRMDIKSTSMAYEHLLRGSGNLSGDKGWEVGQELEKDDAIKLDRLIEFNDDLLDRLDYGEGPFMEQFFRRCHRLQSLDLAVGHPELFSWAAADVLQRCTLSSPSPSPSPSPFCHPVRHQAILPSLQHLSLWSTEFYRLLPQAINDAMTAFAPSLKSVTLSTLLSDSGEAIPTHDLLIRRIHALRSLQLRTVASANTVGDWPFLLPRLTSMVLYIDVGLADCFDTGTFAQAPNLETLILSVPMKSVPEQHQYEQQAGQGWQEEQGHGGDREDERGGGDSGEEDYTSAHWHGGKVLVDADQQEAKFNRTTLYPPWVLPRLKMLVLYGMPAARFDFRSLQSMKQLKELSMSMDNETERAFSVKEYMDLQRKTWKGHWREQGEGQEKGCHESTDRRDQLLQMWALPELKELTLGCCPATVFWLDWLTVCPKLQRANMWMSSGLEVPSLSISRMPFFFSGDAYESSSYSSDSSSGSNDTEGDRSDMGKAIAPLLNSQLSRLELKCTRAMSQQDLKSLLAVYAPFLRPQTWGNLILWEREE
ncbi:hypothetical protein EDD11_006787 [Mortierella claussenii]|nr:hypothetical protein EDD11_006787 [Mortierella claussenii]